MAVSALSLARSTRSRILVIVALFLLISSVLYSLSHSSRLLHHIDHYVQSFKGEKAIFIEKALADDVDGQYDGKGMRDLCATKTWQKGLYFTCDDLTGGIGNVRNTFLNCLRFAIEAGAGFIIPQFTARSASDLLALDRSGMIDMSNWFDKTHFIASLRRDCPQMDIIDGKGKLSRFPSKHNPLKLDPKSLLKQEDLFRGHTLENPDLWRPAFDEWLSNNINETLSAYDPTIVHIARTIFGWRLTHHTPSFFKNFGRILKIRKDLRQLAGSVLWALNVRYALNLDPSEFIMSTSFLGVHLRTEDDATRAGYTGYDGQAPFYLRQAVVQGLAVIYVASGSYIDTERLKETAWEDHGFNVSTKHDLLEGDELIEMEKFSFDQQGLIDYEVLLRSRSFGGISLSTFAWNIASKRHFSGESLRADYLEGVGGQTLDDEWSWLYGPVKHWDMIGISMWP